jgi:hypothetical protein
VTSAGDDQELLGRLACALDAAPSSGLAAVLHDTLVEPLALRHVWLYLLDYGEDTLSLAASERDAGSPPDAIAVAGSAAGRALLARTPVVAEGVLWVPVSQRGESVGVLGLGLRSGREPAAGTVNALGVMVGATVVAARRRYDDWETTRGADELTLPASVQWATLAPTIHREPAFDVAARLEPAEEFGGDAWDFGVRDTTLTFGIFDATGHDLHAAVLGALATSAFRWARRRGADLAGAATAIDDAVAAMGAPTRFVTGVLCDIDGSSGRLRWLCAGHPAPLLVGRDGSVELPPPAVRPPFGLGGECALGERGLTPGDVVLLYSDGIVEAGRRHGRLYGAERLAELAAATFTPDVRMHVAVRRMLDDTVDYEAGPLGDDATIFAVRWGTAA